MSESILRPPAVRDVGSIADWIEATMAIEDKGLFAKASLRKRLAADGIDDEAALSLSFTEIRRRRKIGGPLYPYEAGGAGVKRHPTANPSYDFLLACSLDDAPYRQSRDWNAVVRLFEQLSVVALSNLFGPETKAVRFGYPADAPRPGPFGEALAWLAGKLGYAVGPGRVSPSDQDAGVDAVAWRPFADGRTGFPVVMAQCTLQHEYETKGSDIVLSRWRSLLSIRQDPMTALIVPFSLGSSVDVWEEANFTVDVVLDRFRLCELLATVDLTDWPDRNHLEGWLRRELDEMRLAS
ncbi:MAG: hypothetical protein QOF51_1667 [Chloroflexota bacterium]|jgi:hypothetical protein|nr:hypothetical protein [Chloroflexota bacterium]